MELSGTDQDAPAEPAAAGKVCTRPIDLVYLARFTLGNRALEREVLELFAEQAPLYLGQMRTAADDKGWHMAAHTLKGSARAVGAWKVAEAAEVAESCKSADAVSRGAAMKRIEPLIVETRSYIADLFKD